MGQPMTCCEAFAHAQQSGTDNEEYSAVVKGCLTTGFQIGHHDLPSIKFCPWCGAKKLKEHPVESAGRRVVECMFGPNRGDFEELKVAVAELGDTLGHSKPSGC